MFVLFNRLNYASGRDGFLPKCLGSIHLHYKTPILGVIFHVSDNVGIQVATCFCCVINQQKYCFLYTVTKQKTTDLHIVVF